MKLQKVKSPEPPALFPVRLFLVGVSPEGDEVLRYDLDCAFTALGQTVHIPDPTLKLLP